MWVGDVDIPSDLVAAHRAGTLVLFVGAGASMAPPAGLPSFAGLAVNIAAESFKEPTEPDLANLDAFLGRLQDQDGIDVHARVKAHIDVGGSRPNAAHEAVAALAAAGPTVRIVTTNYDPHLTSSLKTANVAAPEFLAPALPLGHDFEGLVYLHGKTEQDPQRLVVTDRDFGHAYLTDAWAARFLERMFSRFSVLFIGYSHDDVVMSYLARGLRGGGPGRYALTHQPDDGKWRRLAIQPVGYALDGGKHEALPRALAGWAGRAQMGLLDHRQRIAQLVAAPPSQVPEEQSYMEDVLTHDATARLFTELAGDFTWLEWLATRPEFRPLVDDSAPSQESARTLAYWIAEHFVCREEHCERTMQVLRDAGGRPSRVLWHAMAHWLHITGAPRPDWLDRWVPILVSTAPTHEQSWLAYALTASQWESQRDSVLLLFDHLTQPTGSLARSYGIPGAARLEVRLRDDHDDVARAYAAALRPHLAEVPSEVLAIVERQLRLARALLVSAGSASETFDPLSFSRSAIQPHPQDNFPEPISVVIDAARDALEVLLESDPGAASSTISIWSRSGVPLLRRLAVHGWTVRRDVSADQKIAWVLEEGLLYQLDTHQEVFRLLGEAITDCSDVQEQDLLRAVADGPPQVEDEHKAYAIYNALGWLRRHAPTRERVIRAFDEAQAASPEFQERPHPDLHSWSEGGFVEAQPPMATADFADLLRRDADDALAELRKYELADAPWDGPTWSDALGVLTAAVTDEPALGHAALGAQEVTEDLVRAVVRGWSGAVLSSDDATAVAEVLESRVTPGLAVEISQLLAHGGRSEATPTEWHQLAAARRLATRVWEELSEDAPSAIVGAPSLSSAINHPAGHLAEFWLKAVSADWRGSGDAWHGLPSSLREPLDALLDGQAPRNLMASIFLASQLSFCFAADGEWCEARVLPLLSWDYPERARQMWDGYLAWGRPTVPLLKAGLLREYLRCSQHFAEFPEDLQRGLPQHLASIALSSVDPESWLLEWTASAPAVLRARWMSAVADGLDALPADAVEAEWDRWMYAYWKGRVAGVPLGLAPEEASAVAAWVLPLGESLAPGVALVKASAGSFNSHADVLHDLSPDRIAEQPLLWRDFIAHLLRRTEAPFYACHELRRAVEALRAADSSLDLKMILEEALRLDCASAGDW